MSPVSARGELRKDFHQIFLASFNPRPCVLNPTASDREIPFRLTGYETKIGFPFKSNKSTQNNRLL